jgi:hypothetical protein
MPFKKRVWPMVENIKASINHVGLEPDILLREGADEQNVRQGD